MLNNHTSCTTSYPLLPLLTQATSHAPPTHVYDSLEVSDVIVLRRHQLLEDEAATLTSGVTGLPVSVFLSQALRHGFGEEQTRLRTGCGNGTAGDAQSVVLRVMAVEQLYLRLVGEGEGQMR